MSLSVIEGDAFEQMDKVAKLHMEGKTVHAIAKALSITRVEAARAVEAWREVVRSDMESRDAARDHLNDMVKRYDTLIVQLNSNLKKLKDMDFDEKISAQINATIKNIADLDKSRVDLLQKAGLMDNADLGDELAEREAREEALIKILREDLCPDCRMVVARKIQELTKQVEVIQEFND